MKRMFCILAATIILAVFMTGCGCSDRGKIGNGDNGTYTDNNTNNSATNEKTTENRTDNTTNNTDATNTNDTTNPTDNAIGNDNNTTEPATQDTTQEGIAGRVGDAIDEGINGIEEGLMGDEQPTNTTVY